MIAAFSLRRYEDSALIPGTILWRADGLAFEYHTNGLPTNTTFKFTIASTAQSRLGPNLKGLLQSVFRTSAN